VKAPIVQQAGLEIKELFDLVLQLDAGRHSTCHSFASIGRIRRFHTGE
jgi:hypothetical protein